MASQDPLQALIKSMSKAEKRYFKIYANKQSIGKEKLYVRLFDELDRSPTYNKQALESSYAKWGGGKNFSAAKRYLMETVLDAINGFRQSSEVWTQLVRELAFIRILVERGLHKEANKRLQKAKKQAKLHYAHDLLVQFLPLEAKITRSLTGGTDPRAEQSRRALKAETDHELDCLQQMATLRDILWGINNIVDKKGKSIDARQRQQIEVLAALPAVQNNLGDKTSLTLHIDANNIMSFCHYLFNDHASAVRYSTNAMDALYQHPHLINWHLTLINRFARHIGSKMLLGRFKECKKELERFGRIKPPTYDLQKIHFYYYHYYYVSYCFNHPDFSKFNALYASYSKDVKKYGSPFYRPYQLAITLMVAANLFLMQRYKEALQWTDKYLQQPDKKLLEYNIPATLLFRLVIFYETNDWDVFGNMLHNTKNQLRKLGLFPIFCKTMFRFFDAQTQANTKLKKQANYQQLYNDLAEMHSKQTELTAYTSTFNFAGWAEAKANKRSMAEQLLLNARLWEEMQAQTST